MKEFWDNRFSGETYIYGETPNEHFKRFIDNNKPGKILLPGEGEGRNAVYAAQKNWEVYALDQSDMAKEKALKLASKLNVTINYVSEDILVYPYEPNSFDYIVLTFVHLPDHLRSAMHQRIITLLKPGGKLYIIAFSLAQLNNKSGGPKDATMLYSNELLSNDFEHLNIIKNINFSQHLNEGTDHKGNAALIEFEALKTN